LQKINDLGTKVLESLSNHVGASMKYSIFPFIRYSIDGTAFLANKSVGTSESSCNAVPSTISDRTFQGPTVKSALNSIATKEGREIPTDWYQ
jgi:hypothetical protein